MEPDMKEPQILIVDDDAPYLLLVKCILDLEGVKGHYAKSGEEAIGILKENRCTLMITDLNMSGINGLTLSIMAKKLYPDIVIVMITGEIHLGAALAAKAGISKVIYKPCSVEQVREIAKGNLHC
jgi:DNA-binding NtrC family response regulator